MTLYALRTAAQKQDERLVALIHECNEIFAEIARQDEIRAVRMLNAIAQLQLARPKCATDAADLERLARAKA